MYRLVFSNGLTRLSGKQHMRDRLFWTVHYKADLSGTVSLVLMQPQHNVVAELDQNFLMRLFYADFLSHRETIVALDILSDKGRLSTPYTLDNEITQE